MIIMLIHTAACREGEVLHFPNEAQGAPGSQLLRQDWKPVHFRSWDGPSCTDGWGICSDLMAS